MGNELCLGEQTSERGDDVNLISTEHRKMKNYLWAQFYENEF